MNLTKTLFLAWQDSIGSRRWYPVGRLDMDEGQDEYVFHYTKGAEEAAEQSDFEPLLDFPDLHREYRSKRLFPLFGNRVMTSSRKSFPDYLRMLAIEDGKADPFEILEVDGGYRATDSFEVFPKIRKQEDNSFHCRFFLHGWRHTNNDAKDRLKQLVEGEALIVTIELTNPKTGIAVQLQTEDYYMVGWAPRYLVGDLVQAMAYSPGQYRARVVRVNPQPAPSKQRVLVHLSGYWPEEHEPMSSPSFQLIGEPSVVA